MSDNQKKDERLVKVKASLPSLFRAILPWIPGARALGAVAAGSVLVFSIAFPGMLDADTARAVLSAFGV